jgi:hypothetical protein
MVSHTLTTRPTTRHTIGGGRYIKPDSDLGEEIRPGSLSSKLAVLTLSFPRLRLIWCRSPHVTADMFDLLKVPLLLLLLLLRSIIVLAVATRPDRLTCARARINYNHTRGTTLNQIRPL